MSKKLLWSFIKQYIFWLLLFALYRIVFMLSNSRELQGSGFSDIILSYVNALYLDSSTASYLLIIPFILIFFQSIFPFRLFGWVNTIYSYIIIIIYSILSISELPLYKEWGIKLDYKAVSYLQNPSEVLNTASTKNIITNTILIMIFTTVSIIFYNRFIHCKKLINKRNYISSALFFITIPLILFLGIRGGIQQIPINQSDVYFSKHNFLNIAATNTAWNLAHSIEKNKKFMEENPFVFYDDSVAKEIVDSLLTIEADSTVKILKTDNCNIVFIILESWSGGLIKALGGMDSVTSEFDKLQKDGLLFTNIYSSGSLSHQAMASIFSGWPSTPSTSIIKQPNKYQKLPCLITQFNKRGYYSGFYFGGQLSYGNIKGYMYYNQFDNIFEEKDFNPSIPRGNLGVHDEFLYSRLLSDLNKTPEPFFTSAFTMSSHSPYDQPMEDVISNGGEVKPFLNSVYYADRCLGDFMKKAKEQDWYNNTIFIFVADHSHQTKTRQHVFSVPYKQIPMLIYGNALKDEFRGETCYKYGSQVDIAATLLNQFDFNHNEFKWSKDLLNPYSPDYAFYSFDDGLGWVTPGNYFVYLHQQKRIYLDHFKKDANKEKIITDGKSYLQVLFQDYLDY